MNNVAILNSAGWVLVGTAKTTITIEVINGGTVMMFIGASAPSGGTFGFTLPRNQPYTQTNVAALGGGIWLRAPSEDVIVRYATA